MRVRQSISALLMILVLVVVVGCQNSANEQSQERTSEANQQENQITETVDPQASEASAGQVQVSPLLDTAIPTESVLNPYQSETVAVLKAENYWIQEWAVVLSMIQIREVFAVTGGTYDGQVIRDFLVSCQGICFDQNVQRFAYNKQTDRYTHLVAFSSAEIPKFLEAFVANANTDSSQELEAILPPATITVPSGAVVERSPKYYPAATAKTDPFDGAKVVFTDPVVGDVYGSDTEGTLYIRTVDGYKTAYMYKPDFFASQVATQLNSGAEVMLAQEYDYALGGGCGIDPGNYQTIPNFDESLVQEVGTTADGTKLFTLRAFDPEKTFEQVTEAEWLVQQSYQAASFADPEITVDQFLAGNPLLFWQDPLERWVALVHKSVQPVAECGKPVVYLYPEEPTKVDVKVEIDELTVTIPEHGTDGWSVLAQPNGELTNLKDGKEYPYLFWEGHKNGGVSPTKGFVVARNDVASFLKKSLKKLGLNKQESADFRDFWVENMLENPEPYFFISFIGTQDFNRVAPLTITPEPDTLVRVFMYYDPLFNKIKVQEQELIGFERKGFTVVEWGGTASRPWHYE